MSFSFRVNGALQQVQVEPWQMLSDVLRESLGLTGTKIACQEAECGSCTVLVDGQPILSCTYPALKAGGKDILTIEGLATNGALHPLQEAFIKHGAVQCGFCIPGQIMTAYALLQEHPTPSEKDIRYALKDTLCRCGGYPSIINAIQAAAEQITSSVPIQPPNLSSSKMQVIGGIVYRPDALGKVDGSARFTDDYSFPGMLHAAVLRAGTPHAILKSLEVQAAIEIPGVRALLTAEDIPGSRVHGVVSKDWPVLVGIGEKARYVGDALAIVAADTKNIARDAVDAIQFELESLPVVSDPVNAHDPASEKVHESGNLLEEINVVKGDLNAGFRQASVHFEQTYHTPIMEHLFMEPECSIARPLEGGRMEVYVGSQIPYEDREQIAASLGVPEDQVRVIGTLIGGGFGGKEDIAGQIHAALLAQATGQPVKLLFDRQESMLTHPKRHATQIRVRMGTDPKGNLLASQTELYGDTGAYASLGEHVMTRATTHSTGPYVVPNVEATCYAMYTNNPPAGAFRGFGALQAAFAIESAMDELAEQLGVDPVDLRRRNALREGTVSNTGQLLDHSVGLLECLDVVDKAVRETANSDNPFQAIPVEGNEHARMAWGFALAFKNTGLGGGAADKASAEVELYPDGTIQVRTSSAEIGQGLVTVLQMIAAEELALPVEQVSVLLSDTDLTLDGGPTTGSRQTYVSGNAVLHAAIALRQAMTSTLTERFDCPPEDIHYKYGAAQVPGDTLLFSEIANLMQAEGRTLIARYEYWAPQTQPLGSGGDMHFAFSFAAQAAQVEVELRTGLVKVLQIIAATDVGRAINPLGLQGQIEGGIMMGIGHALTEEFIVEDGDIFTDTMARYRMPSISYTPEITHFLVEHPTRHGPYGAKGVGEISTMPTIPAITNAVYHASGVRVRKLPIDQDWLALQIAKRM
jgi:xanthine dehydrogenase molybdenum-binding subunit